MEEEWYYCLEHEAVEPKLGCRMVTRLGPYPTREDAQKALETAEQRNEEWDGADEDWEDGDK